MIKLFILTIFSLLPVVSFSQDSADVQNTLRDHGRIIRDLFQLIDSHIERYEKEGSEFSTEYQNTKRRLRSLETIHYPTYPLKGKIFSVGTVAKYKMPDTLMFDGKLNTYWESRKDSAIVGFEFDTAKVLRDLRYAPRKGFESRVRGAMIQGSNDNKIWYTIYTIPDDVVLENKLYQVVLDNEAPYKWIRVVFAKDSYGNCAELEFLGY